MMMMMMMMNEWRQVILWNVPSDLVGDIWDITLSPLSADVMHRQSLGDRPGILRDVQLNLALLLVSSSPVSGLLLSHTGPDLGGARGPGPQASHQKGASHQTLQFLFRAHYRVN